MEHALENLKDLLHLVNIISLIFLAIENDDDSSSNLGAAVEEIEKEQEDITISNLAEKVLYDLKEHADI